MSFSSPVSGGAETLSTGGMLAVCEALSKRWRGGQGLTHCAAYWEPGVSSLNLEELQLPSLSQLLPVGREGVLSKRVLFSSLVNSDP